MGKDFVTSEKGPFQRPIGQTEAKQKLQIYMGILRGTFVRQEHSLREENVLWGNNEQRWFENWWRSGITGEAAFGQLKMLENCFLYEYHNWILPIIQNTVFG